jgi:pimeloyl-ACP methyl ester carboxylesterase
MKADQELRVPVSGGSLAGGVWNPAARDAAPVLAIHGITATHLSWVLVAGRLPGVRLIAPDLRGRGRSGQLPPPWGIRDHADDMVRVLDALEVDRAVVAGHSMGAFVAVRTADQHPDRVSALVLVDGGLPLPLPPGIPEDELAATLLGPAGERLSRTYASREAYTAFWREHPAFRDHWNPAVEAYVQYDLDAVEGGFRSSARLEAVAANVVQQSGDDGYREALAGLRVPVDFLRAHRGLVDDPPGLYPDGLLDESAPLIPQLRVHEIDDVNHYTLLLSDSGARSVAEFVGRVARERG